MWNTAKERMAPRDAARLYLSCGHDFARARFGAIEGLDAFCAAAEQVNDAIDPAGLALYAGIDAEPLPDDAPARAMHLCSCCARPAAARTSSPSWRPGCRRAHAHAIKRPTEMASSSAGPTTPPSSDDDRARWQQAEELTDRLLAPAFATLDDDGQEALLAGLDAMKAAL